MKNQSRNDKLPFWNVYIDSKDRDEVYLKIKDNIFFSKESLNQGGVDQVECDEILVTSEPNELKILTNLKNWIEHSLTIHIYT